MKNPDPGEWLAKLDEQISLFHDVESGSQPEAMNLWLEGLRHWGCSWVFRELEIRKASRQEETNA